jgi:hypothetical protein
MLVDEEKIKKQIDEWNQEYSNLSDKHSELWFKLIEIDKSSRDKIIKMETEIELNSFRKELIYQRIIALEDVLKGKYKKEISKEEIDKLVQEAILNMKKEQSYKTFEETIHELLDIERRTI